MYSNCSLYEILQNRREKLCIRRYTFRAVGLCEKLRLCRKKTAHQPNPVPPQILIIFTEIMLDPQLFKVPLDVVFLRQQSGMVGLMDWPTYTHQEDIDVIELLPTHCTEDYDRIILLQKL